ncbi:MAG: AraC family transcriptional regulator [Burkholderiaceae bacterium]|nr:AraC family transcriptional regulator [Burkholderiaceae bacterium]
MTETTLAPPTVAIVQVRHVLAGARARGLDLGPLLARAGIAPALLDSPLARVSQGQYAMLLRALRRATRCELWGLLSRPVPPGSFGQCAAQLVHCKTLEEALRKGFAFHHLLIDDFTARLSVQGGLARVQIVRHAPFNARLDYAQKAFLLFGFGLASWLVARRVPIVEVDYTVAMPGSDSSRVYQAPIRAGRPHLGFTFESRWLALPVVQNPQSLREFLARAPANLLIKYRDPGSSTERIRRLLRRHLGLGDELPSLEEVGTALGMTPQTLRRRLRDEGRGYQELKDDLRRDTAIALLAQPELTLIDIAAQVGFSEASTFHRAFKKWTGVAPGEYRHTRIAGPA